MTILLTMSPIASTTRNLAATVCALRDDLRSSSKIASQTKNHSQIARHRISWVICEAIAMMCTRMLEILSSKIDATCMKFGVISR